MHNILQIDPSGTYQHCTPRQVVDACGLLLPWVLEAFSRGEPIESYVFEQYQFPTPPMTGGTVDPVTGAYSYPDDPDLQPYVIIRTSPTEAVYIYPYGMITFIADGVTTTYRMD